ncbi:MAG: TonB-dependent receptor [Thermodesulfobacteriota bacterium]
MPPVLSRSLAAFLLATGLLAEPLTAVASEAPELDLYFRPDQLVEVATRAPKPLNRVAENVSVVTAAEIEAMGARTVLEALRFVTGAFVSDNGEMVNQGVPFFQGADYEPIAILVDGMRWNEWLASFPETITIPIHLVDRIEVIRGPAASAWGSGLGGVVNIITKGTGSSATPAATARLRLGEQGIQEHDGELAGMVAAAGYYLYAGRLESDGLRWDRFSEKNRVFAKLRLPASEAVSLTMSVGSLEHQGRNYNWVPFDLDADLQAGVRDTFFREDLQVRLGRELTASLGLRVRRHETLSTGGAMSDGSISSVDSQKGDDRTTIGQLVWSPTGHTLVLGAEHGRAQVDEELSPALVQPARRFDEAWAVYANDTMVLRNLSLIPGLRYDHFSLSNPILSPSLGATCQLTPATLLRALVAHGFRRPPINYKTADPVTGGNPALLPETTWSYQAGLETWIIPHLRAKTSLFQHDSRQAWERDPTAPYILVNAGAITRRGVELELETEAWRGLSLAANYAFVREHSRDINPDPSIYDDDSYTANLIGRYDAAPWQVRLAGHFTWWGVRAADDTWNGSFDDVLWDLAVTYTLFASPETTLSLFGAGRNLFGGSEFSDEWSRNPGRSLEAGLTWRF